MSALERPSVLSSDGCCIFNGLAQVMVRRDIGWEPMGAGGLSRVKLLQHRPEKQEKEETTAKYSIEACQDNGKTEMLLLECQIDADTSYTRINPTFYSWTTAQQSRVGLTFDTFAAAERFEGRFLYVLRKLRQESGSDLTDPQTMPDAGSSSGAGSSKMWGSCQHISSQPAPPHRCHPPPRSQHQQPLTDDDITAAAAVAATASNAASSSITTATADIPCSMRCFQSPADVAVCPQYQLNQQQQQQQIMFDHLFDRPLPMTTGVRYHRSASASSAPCLLRLNTCSSQDGPVPTTLLPQKQHQPRRRSRGMRLGWCCSSCKDGDGSGAQQNADYGTGPESASTAAAVAAEACTTSSSVVLDLVLAWAPPPDVLTCVHCRRRYRPTSNPPGSCELAPDRVRALLDLVTMRTAASRLMALCDSANNSTASDEEARSESPPPPPCDCTSLNCRQRRSSDTSANQEEGAGKQRPQQYRRRTGLRAVVSGLVYCLLPCLCCRRPCLLCYEACVDWGIAGGRHSVVRRPPSSMH